MAPANDKLSTSILKIPVEQLRHLEVNARYMTADQQQRLTENIKRDGGLTSLPLVWLIQDEKGKAGDPPAYEIVSGNHRVLSAKDAGLTEIDCIVITNYLTPERRVEIQLAHNAVTGQDDLSVLEELYEALDLDGKQYSGLTDDLFSSLKDLSMSGFNVDAPEYQEIVLSFLPQDADEFLKVIDRAGKSKTALVLAARYAEFDQFFDAIVRTKEVHNIQNNAMAITALAEMAMERLDQLEAEIDGQDQGDEPEAPDVIE